MHLRPPFEVCTLHPHRNAGPGAETHKLLSVWSLARDLFGGGRRQAVPWSPAAASRTVGPKLQVEALPRAPRGGRRVRGARCTTLLILQAPTSPQNTKIVTRGIFRTAKMENKENDKNEH